MVYDKSLKESDEVKRSLVLLVHGLGKSIAEAARSLGISERSAQKFFNKETNWAKLWWEGKDVIKYLGDNLKPTPHDIQNIFESVSGLKKINGVYQDPDVIGCLPKNPYEVSFKDVMKSSNHREYEVSDDGKWLNFGKKEVKGKSKKILVVGDTQCKPSEDLSYMSWIGQYIRDKKPDVIVHIGDHYDFPSLSSYDKGKKSFEGRRLKADIEAGNLGMKLLLDEFTSSDYKPRMVFCMGNHCDRFDRLKNDMPELDGFVGTELLPLAKLGWEVYPFLKPVEIDGIFFVHYLANPMTGKPYAGTALTQLKTVGRSFVVGHKQVLDVCVRNTLDGKQQIGVINGACYPFDESYKGFQGNSHFRGITMLHEVKDGSALPMFISLDYLKNRYEN